MDVLGYVTRNWIMVAHTVTKNEHKTVLQVSDLLSLSTVSLTKVHVWSRFSCRDCLSFVEIDLDIFCDYLYTVCGAYITQIDNQYLAVTLFIKSTDLWLEKQRKMPDRISTEHC